MKAQEGEGLANRRSAGCSTYYTPRGVSYLLHRIAMEIMPIRDFGLLQPNLTRAPEMFETHPTLMVLATAGDDRKDWARAGQALQRVLLTATWLKLATTPISQPVEIPAIRTQLSDTTKGGWAQMILRVGYGRPAAATPRRPLSEVLLPSNE